MAEVQGDPQIEIITCVTKRMENSFFFPLNDQAKTYFVLYDST